jgi:exonuclease SbcC
MIPLRVRLAGFLSYRESQEVRFGPGVWLLAGNNGSGKSAIFDGVTFALFGVHRGGAQNYLELINKETPNASVEFDFRIGPDTFRVKRTLKRTKTGTATATQQLFAAAGESWEPVPDTTKKIDFDKWVHQNLGLTYETFTSSVLLLQNKAEKLLDARPAGRAEVLAGIVDLERYQKLHKLADQRRLTYKGQHEELEAQLASFPQVTDEQLAEAELKVKESVAAKGVVIARVESLLAAEGLARQWAASQTRLAAVREKLRKAEETLAEAVGIERDYERLNELNAVLPAVELVVAEKAKIAEADRKTLRLKAEQDEARKKKETNERKANEAKESRDKHRIQWQADDATLHATKDEYVRLVAVLEQVKLVEELKADVDRLTTECDELPADAAARAEAARAEVDALTEISRQLPAAGRLKAERTEWEEARKTDIAAMAAATAVKAEGERARKEADAATTARAEAQVARSKAEAALAVASARFESARQAHASFDDLAGEPSCRACGQPLTPAHLDAERAKRTGEVRDAEAAVERATAALKSASARDEEAVKVLAEATATLERLRAEFREHQTEAHDAKKGVERLTKSIATLERELPEALRVADLSAVAERVAGLDAAKRALTAANAAVERRRNAEAQREAKAHSLARMKEKLPEQDPVALRELVTTKNRHREQLANAVKAGKSAAETADRQADLFGREAHDAAIRLTELAGKLIHEDQARTYSQDAIRRALTSLPLSWRGDVDRAGLVQHDDWRRERDELIRKGTKDRFQHLAAARGGLESIRLDVASAERDADSFPPQARRDPDEIGREVVAVRKTVAERDADVATAERAKADLARDRLRRGELHNRERAAALELHRYKTLAELLGRDRLQRHLVRTAEKQIVDHANAILDRLSAGTLFLRLVAGEDTDDRVLDLECWNRQTGGSPIPVAFLSGGQRFRVAMALSLGIGQYASRQHRPVESVIIDEGFGSLDRTGRQSVIQELQNLRGLLACVILVSHQDEFADAFPQGYRFAIEDGATTVTGLHPSLTAGEG